MFAPYSSNYDFQDHNISPWAMMMVVTVMIAIAMAMFWTFHRNKKLVNSTCDEDDGDNTRNLSAWTMDHE